MSSYRWINFRRRAKQTICQAKIFSFPGLSKIRQRAYTKEFNAGKNLEISFNVNISRTHNLPGVIKIGNNVHINSNVHIDYSGEIVIGDDVDIAENCVILSHKHSSFNMTNEGQQYKPVPVKTEIKQGARLQIGCIICPGVTIGEYANVYSGAVVFDDVEPYTIVMGNPARDIREFAEEKIEKRKRDRQKRKYENNK